MGIAEGIEDGIESTEIVLNSDYAGEKYLISELDIK